MVQDGTFEMGDTTMDDEITMLEMTCDSDDIMVLELTVLEFERVVKEYLPPDQAKHARASMMSFLSGMDRDNAIRTAGSILAGAYDAKAGMHLDELVEAAGRKRARLSLTRQ